jgi:uncharacterized membrane protein
MKKISVAAFWLLFFCLFLFFIIPTYRYFTEGFPAYLQKNSLPDQGIFALHIFCGIVVYLTGAIQFTPSIRNRNIALHRKIGKVYMAASLLCIATLYTIISNGLCTSCRSSQYMVTTLWLLFVVLGYYFIRQRKIQLHRQMMISSFICASYFVTVRIVDRFAMGFFRASFDVESTQFLVSDISVWLVPLMVFHLYSFIASTKNLVHEIKQN